MDADALPDKHPGHSEDDVKDASSLSLSNAPILLNMNSCKSCCFALWVWVPSTQQTDSQRSEREILIQVYFADFKILY